MPLKNRMPIYTRNYRRKKRQPVTARRRTREQRNDILSTYNRARNGCVCGCTSVSISWEELRVIREARLGIPHPEEELDFHMEEKSKGHNGMQDNECK
jgi:hypothetical protein